MFPPTQSNDEPDRPHPGADALAAAPARQTGAAVSVVSAGNTVHTALSSLSPSLLQDLQRFEPGGSQRELLEVLAAGIRHSQPLAIDLACDAQRLTLNLFAQDRRVHCSLPLAALLATDLAALQVLLVRPATRRLAPDAATGLAEPDHYGPLHPLLWAVALRGARTALLPELAGQAAYRVSPSLDLAGLDVPAAMLSCINRLRRQTCNLADIARWHNIGMPRAMRLLNALYLQSGLIVSHTHPAATNEGWTGYANAI